MIILPERANISKDMRDLVAFFNKLEQDLEYPNCEGQADARRCIEAAEEQLINSGILEGLVQ
jgi:hypothetical protein